MKVALKSLQSMTPQKLFFSLLQMMLAYWNLLSSPPNTMLKPKTIIPPT
jgi:hypothetical protein